METKKSKIKLGRIFIPATIILVILKLLNVVTFSWLLVLSYPILMFGLVVTYFILTYTYSFLNKIKEDREHSELQSIIKHLKNQKHN